MDLVHKLLINSLKRAEYFCKCSEIASGLFGKWLMANCYWNCEISRVVCSETWDWNKDWKMFGHVSAQDKIFSDIF